MSDEYLDKNFGMLSITWESFDVECHWLEIRDTKRFLLSNSEGETNYIYLSI